MRWSKSARGLVCVGLAMLAACDEGGGGEAVVDRGVVDLDRGLIDGGPSTIWDSGLDGQVMRADRFIVERDASVEVCLSEGAVPVAGATGAAIPGAVAMRADLDVDGDGQPDVAVKVVNAEGVRFELLDGETLEPAGTLALPGARDAVLMPAVWPAPDGLQAPIELGADGATGFVALETRADGPVGLRVISAAGASLRFIELPQGVSQLQLMNTGGGWRVLLNDTQGGCAVYGLSAEAALGAWEACWVAPGWDVNSDGAIDIVRTSAGGVAVLDAQTLEPALQVGEGIRLGVAPPVPAAEGAAAGPVDLRGMGPEVIGVLIERGLRLTYRDPVALTAGEEDPQVVAGNQQRFEFFQAPEGLRLWTEEDRGGLRVLKVLAPGATLRPRGEIGPFRYLSWGLGPDVDADGYPEVWVLGGSSERGDNTAVRFLSTHDGREVFTLPAERNARFDVSWAPGGGGGLPYDLDGCEGAERVAVRRGNGTAGGPTPTRLVITDAQGAVAWRGDGVDSFAHSAAVADVDGDGQMELLELLDTTGEGATVTTWRLGAAP